MILGLPGFDKITDQITFGLIQCFHKEKNETPNKSAFEVSYRRVPITRKTACGILKCGFLQAGSYCTQIKTENAEVTAMHQ